MHIQNPFHFIKGVGFRPEFTPLMFAARLAMLLLLLVIFGCECPGPELPPKQKGIFIEQASGTFNPGNRTHGETVELPVMIKRMPGEIEGETVTVTPSSVAGITFDPPSVNMTVPAEGAKAYTTFVATIGDETPASAQTGFTAIRTHGANANSTEPADYSTGTNIDILANMVSVTVTPDNPTIIAGESQDFTLAILPRGHTHGDIALTFHTAEANNATFTPSGITVNLVQGSTTPEMRTVSLTPNGSGTFGPRFFNIRNAEPTVVGTGLFTLAGTTTGTFEIAATPLEITTPNGMISAQSVAFTVSSVGGFSGPIKITWVPDGPVAPSPSDNDFVVQVAPGVPATFTRKFYRFATFSNPIPVTFNATDSPVTTTKGVTITVKTP